MISPVIVGLAGLVRTLIFVWAVLLKAAGFEVNVLWL